MENTIGDSCAVIFECSIRTVAIPWEILRNSCSAKKMNPSATLSVAPTTGVTTLPVTAFDHDKWNVFGQYVISHKKNSHFSVAAKN